jgi:hypothetical protein
VPFDRLRAHRHQAEPSYYVIRSPVGYIDLDTNQGTLALRHTAFSAAISEASKPKQRTDAA